MEYTILYPIYNIEYSNYRIQKGTFVFGLNSRHMLHSVHTYIKVWNTVVACVWNTVLTVAKL